MSKVSFVLDASAALVLINDEPGADQVREALPNAVICAVSVAEIVSTLAEAGFTDREIAMTVEILPEPVAFSVEMVSAMVKIRRSVQILDLSLGGGCCLAFAVLLKLPVLTADQDWGKVRVRGLRIALLDRG